MDEKSNGWKLKTKPAGRTGRLKHIDPKICIPFAISTYSSLRIHGKRWGIPYLKDSKTSAYRSHPSLTHQRYCQLNKSMLHLQSHRGIIFKPIQIISIKFPPCHKKFHGWTLDTASPGLNLTRCCSFNVGQQSSIPQNNHSCVFVFQFG